jgi:LuxR family transcriptional regulator
MRFGGGIARPAGLPQDRGARRKGGAMDRRAQIDALVAGLAPLAPAGYFLALRVRGSSPLLSFRTYPPAWTEHYMANGYLLRDPVTTWALTVGGTIRWSSPFLPDPFGVFRQAAAHGLRFGASVAHGPVRALSIGSFARGDREMTDAEIAEARRIVTALHDLTELPAALSDTDRALLAAQAAGEGVAAAAGRLGLAEATARQHLRQLCDRLFAATPDEAVQRARDHRLL